MTEITLAIDLMSIMYMIIAIPLIITLSKLGWVICDYLKATLDLKW